MARACVWFLTCPFSLIDIKRVCTLMTPVNPYAIEKRTDVSTNTRSSTGAVRREVGRARRGANRALTRLIGKRVRLEYERVRLEYDQAQIAIMEEHNFIGEITAVSPSTGELRVRFGDVSITGVSRSEIELLE
jgi:hypothetical protein